MKRIARNIRTALSLILCGALVFLPALGVSGCNESQFEQVVNQIGPAVSTILQIIALVKGSPADSALAEKVSGDAGALEKLYADYEADRSAVAKTSVEANINAAFAALNSDLSQVFSIAQVKDKNTQAKLSALIGLVQTAVQIAESAFPGTQPPTAAQFSVSPVSLSASTLVSSWNKILTAKTGNPVVDNATPKMKLHVHSEAARIASFGLAQ